MSPVIVFLFSEIMLSCNIITLELIVHAIDISKASLQLLSNLITVTPGLHIF